MSGLLGGGGAAAATQAPTTQLQIQTSAAGNPLPIAYGTSRFAGNLIWYGGFYYTASASGGSGKGGVVGGGKGGSAAGYNYFASWQFGLCEGPINGIGSVWSNGNKETASYYHLTTSNGDYAQDPWTYLVTNYGYLNEANTIPATGPYTVQVAYPQQFMVDNGVTGKLTLAQATTVSAGHYTMQQSSGNLIFTFPAAYAGATVTIKSPSRSASYTIPASAPYTVTWSAGGPQPQTVTITNLAYTLTGGAPASGQYSTDGAGNYTFNSAQAGDAITISYASNTQVPVFAAMGYSGIAWSGAPNYALGQSPSLPNFNWEIKGFYSNTVDLYSAPAAPTIALVTGTLSITTYYVRVTWVNAYGETLPSAESMITVGLGQHKTLKVTAPTSPPTGATGWNVYVGNTASGGSGTETRQNKNVIDIGTDWTMPNTGVVVGDALPAINTTGLPDADPSLVVYDLMTNAKYGAGFPSSKIGDLTNYQNYALAQGLLVSFVLNTQTPANTILMDLAMCTNSAWAWVDGAMTLVPYGDTAITGNGKTYTPPAAPEYDLGDADFIRKKGNDPVQLNRKRPVDAANWIQMSFSNRNTQYNPDTVEYKNEVWINKFKIRPMPTSTIGNNYFCDSSIAQTSVNLQGQRQLVLNTFTFDLDQRYILLDCMDIVSLTDSTLGLNKQWVRITSIQENSDYTLTFEAEEYLGGTGASATNSFQENAGYATNFNIDPGSVNAPIILTAPVQIATNTGLEIWTIVSGSNVNYGGCQVWVSSDNTNYKQIGQVNGNARQGVSTTKGTLPMGIDMSQSNSQLLSGAPIDAELSNTLCIMVSGSEISLFSYTTALLSTTSYNYNLDGLNYGLYGSDPAPPGDFAIGTPFARLDNQTFIMPFNKNQINQNIYMKFLAFNIYGGGQQALSDVDPYIITAQGPPLPPSVITFNGAQVDNSVAFQWSQVTDFALKGYHILYGPQGAGIGAAIFLTQATKGTEMTNAAVLPGCWTFYIYAVDIADQLSLIPAQFDLCVVNKNVIIGTDYEGPQWSWDYNPVAPAFSNVGASSYGSIASDFVKHWTGIIIPTSTTTAAQFQTIAAPTAPILYTSSGGSLSERTYYVTVSYVIVNVNGREETLCSSETSILVPVNELLTVTSPIAPPDFDFLYTSGAFPQIKYNVYISETSGAETLQSTAPVVQGIDWSEPFTGLISGAAMPTQNLTGFYPFDHFVPVPPTFCEYFSKALDLGFDANTRIWADITIALGPGEAVLQESVFELSTKTAGGSWSAFTPWAIQYVTARYIQGALEMSTLAEGAVPYFSKFNIVVDGAQSITDYNSFTVGIAGETLTFDQEYSIAPTVQITPTDGTTTGGNATSVTTTNCFIQLYVGSTPTAGTANITVRGT